MEPCCDLRVDVNGEETFVVDKTIISNYSGRLRKLFGKSANSTRNLKVIFHDFPGGAESFELITRFCYNKGIADINNSNICILHCAAHFMEMNNSVSGSYSLFEQTQKSLQEISYWTWHDLLTALKQCQDLLLDAASSGILDKCLDSLVGRLASAGMASPCPSTSSTDSSGFRFSCDTRSSESKNSPFRASWWFEDLLFFNPTLLEMAIKSMILRKLDHTILSRFLFCYQKCKFCTASSEEKRKIVETVIDLLYLLDTSSVSCKSLFSALRAALSSKAGKCFRKKLESMIGSQLDQATLDNLLVPSSNSTNCMYDVNLVLKFAKAFLYGGKSRKCPVQLRKVGSLMDLYIAEVAPDPCLKPSKFRDLVNALPDSARDSNDEIYRAMDMYLEVHRELTEEEKIEICCALNYEKLSAEACKHLSQNAKFPSKTAIQGLKSLVKINDKCRSNPDSVSPLTDKGKKQEECNDQIVVYGGEIDPTDENEKLKANLEGMQWRVMELESVCKKMQSQMGKVLKSRMSTQKSSRSLPKLCS